MLDGELCVPIVHFPVCLLLCCGSVFEFESPIPTVGVGVCVSVGRGVCGDWGVLMCVPCVCLWGKVWSGWRRGSKGGGKTDPLGGKCVFGREV